MTNRFSAFLSDQHGVVNLDWTLVSAAVVGMGLAVITLLSGAADTTTTHTAGVIAGYEVNDTFDTEAELAALVQSADPDATTDN